MGVSYETRKLAGSLDCCREEALRGNMTAAVRQSEIVQPESALTAVWERRLAQLDHAFQPIVNVHTGLCYGYEALLRGTETAGFESIQAVFDTAHTDDVLPQVESLLWARAIEKFATLAHHRNVKLFCNADNRGVIAHAEHRAATLHALAAVGL